MFLLLLNLSRGEVDLSTLEPEKTHSLGVELEDNAGMIDLLLTISGTSGTESISDLGSFVADPNRERELIKRYVSSHLVQWSDKTCKQILI